MNGPLFDTVTHSRQFKRLIFVKYFRIGQLILDQVVPCQYSHPAHYDLKDKTDPQSTLLQELILSQHSSSERLYKCRPD